MWLSKFLIGLVRIVVGASPRWIGAGPSPAQRIYFANHSSHIDTVALWSALPPELRARTRPVAAADYWGKGAVRRYVVLKGLNAVLIDRSRGDPSADPLQPLAEALERGDSLILASRFPKIELVPVYLENLHRSLPKGTVFPVPLICTVRFGAPLQRIAGEGKEAFLQRARNAVVELA
jgi:1-acyl-sn-glycerol-3-phosphate acyltransferase